MSKPSSRVHINGAYVIKSAESRPRAIQAAGMLNGRAAVVTPRDKQLAEAVLRRHAA